jgi:ParB family chromosome partitioning protein
MSGTEKKPKYPDIDQLLGGGSDLDAPKDRDTATSRTRRPTPAIGAMVGDKRTTTVTDALKAEKNAALNALEDAKRQFEDEKAQLMQEIADAKSQEIRGAPISLTMPVTKQKVEFELLALDTSLIDVSPENERIQEFLDEISLRDILPSIKKRGQQKPGMVRPTKSGRYELIEGSRRLASVKLLGGKYLALVGQVPDADVRELGVIENKHQDVSAYEKATAYQRQIENGEYENWTQLGAAKGISSSHISRYRACVTLDPVFVRILPSPSDMPLSYAETISKLRKKGEEELLSKARELFEMRTNALSNGNELQDVEDVISSLKSAVRIKAEAPKAWKPVVYKSKDGKVLKHTITNKGATKLEITGVDQDQIDKLVSYLASTLKVE